MKILFIENRQRTEFWDKIAKDLENNGHEIYWIVQNHLFQPKTGVVFNIPYFNGKYNKEKVYNDDVNKIISSNRGINHNNINSDDFIFYYDDQIIAFLDIINPDICFGESTQFHELIICKECKNRKILFLHPTSCRYPIGRFSFYKFDSLEPFGGSKESLETNEAFNLINSIVNRKCLPDYMIVPKKKSFWDILFKDKIYILRGYLSGEKFITPSPIIKYKQIKNTKKRLNQWDELCKIKNYKHDPLKTKLLYPLQMQPESSIDVWATEYINQLQTIKNIVNNLSEGEILYVKLNPKAYLELNEELLQYCFKSTKVFMLPSHVKMGDIFDNMDIIITTTGTVSMEAILANKPSIILSWMINVKSRNCIQLTNWSQLRSIIESVKTNTFPKITDEEKINFINILNKTSYVGACGDSLYSRHFLEDESNMNNVKNAFKDILDQYVECKQKFYPKN